MKISKVIEVLERAKQDYGDVDVMVEDHEYDTVSIAKMVIKLYPNAALYDAGDKDKPVDAIAIATWGWDKDLILWCDHD